MQASIPALLTFVRLSSERTIEAVR